MEAQLGDLTAQCIRCGFCLEACPTFRITGSELDSPRGRIYLARSADEAVIDWSDAKSSLDRCLGCLACEPACPSGVRYGDIVEIAHSRAEGVAPADAKRLLVDAVTSSSLMRLATAAPWHSMPGPIAKLFGSDRQQARLPHAEQGRLPSLQEALPALIGEVYVLEGCAMRALFPRVHLATRRLLRRIGYQIRDVNAECCGSMHAHAGYLDEAGDRAGALMAAMPDDLPVIVDSAGCGSTMKRYSSLVLNAEAFSRRVFDVTEFLQDRGLAARLRESAGLPGLSVTYHDACHLAHGQGIKSAPRELITSIPGIDFSELHESDTCCGSAGIYNVTQPTLARQLLDRKMQNVQASQCEVVVTGNPGCHAWMSQGAGELGEKIQVMHTTELLEASFIGLEPFA